MSSTDSIIGRVLLFAAFAALSGCATVEAPSGYLPGADETQWDAYGGWITVQYSQGSQAVTAEGEFIGLRDSSLCVLTESQPVLIRCDKVTYAELDVHTKLTTTFGIWATLGTLSVPSHGGFMIFSLPMWLLTGIPSTVSASYDGHYQKDTPPASWWRSVSKFSRFPQGVPEEIDLQRLKLKRYHHE